MGITKKTIIEFGIGDIRITPSPLELGVIGFKQESEVREIGTKEPIKDTYSQNEEEVLLKFTNPKSVSLVIEALEIIKADLEKSQDSKKEQNF